MGVTQHLGRLLQVAKSAINKLGVKLQMAAKCDVCGKGPGFGHQVSHSNVKTKRRFNPNIQRVKAIIKGTPKHVNVCTSCLRAGKVAR